jgi:hypothetical protein
MTDTNSLLAGHDSKDSSYTFTLLSCVLNPSSTPYDLLPSLHGAGSVSPSGSLLQLLGISLCFLLCTMETTLSDSKHHGGVSPGFANIPNVILSPMIRHSGLVFAIVSTSQLDHTSSQHLLIRPSSSHSFSSADNTSSKPLSTEDSFTNEHGRRSTHAKSAAS